MAAEVDLHILMIGVAMTVLLLVEAVVVLVSIVRMRFMTLMVVVQAVRVALSFTMKLPPSTSPSTRICRRRIGK